MYSQEQYLNDILVSIRSVKYRLKVAMNDGDVAGSKKLMVDLMGLYNALVIETDKGLQLVKDAA